jgi:hypothetical protein
MYKKRKGLAMNAVNPPKIYVIETNGVSLFLS